MSSARTDLCGGRLAMIVPTATPLPPTDEVYGSIEEPLEADENYPLRASSPYSASTSVRDMNSPFPAIARSNGS